MSEKICVAVAIILAVFCVAFIVINGDTGVYSFSSGGFTVDDFTVTAENGKVEVTGKQIKDGRFIVTEL